MSFTNTKDFSSTRNSPLPPSELAMASKRFVTSRPGKLLFTLWFVSLNAARLPFWMIYFIPSFLRPNPKWSYNQTLRIRLMREFLKWMSTIELGKPLLLESGQEGDQFIKIPPASAKKYIGVVALDSEIKPTTIGGTWYPKPPSQGSAGTVVVHFHGGAYVVGDGRAKDAGGAAKALLGNTLADHVLCPQYRLASSPGGRFPAFLQDAITSLLYLTDTLKIPTEKIIISGDSAGGHLCLSLLRYIHDNPDAKVPSPACAWLWSPWADPGAALIPGDVEKSPHAPTDYITEGFAAWGARRMTPSKASGVTMDQPNISIKGNAFACPTPLFFSTGECEILYYDIVKIYEEFKAIPGNKLRLEIEKAAVHDILLTGHYLGFEKEAAFAAKRAGDFMVTSM